MCLCEYVCVCVCLRLCVRACMVVYTAYQWQKKSHFFHCVTEDIPANDTTLTYRRF